MPNPYQYMRTSRVLGQRPGNDFSPMLGKRFLGGISPTYRNPVNPLPIEDPVVEEPVDSGQSYFDEMMRVEGDHPARTAYQESLANPPQREDYKPGWKRTVGSILAGAAAGWRDPEAGGRIVTAGMGAPYNRALEEYGRNTDTLGESARIEGTDADRRLKILSEARALGLDYDKLDLDRLDKERDFNVAQGNLKVNQDRADAYIKNFGKADYQYEPQEDGSVLAINKADPSKRQIIPGHTVAAKTARIAAGSLAVSQKNAETNSRNVDSNVEYRKRLPVNNPPLPTQQAAAQSNALNQLFRSPQFKKYITLDSQSSAEPYVLKDDDGSLVYQELKRQLRAKVKAALEQGNPFGDDSFDTGDDSGDITIEPEF